MSQGSLRLGLCAGEASGDLLAGAMLRAWQQRGTSLDITGIGGDQIGQMQVLFGGDLA